MLVAGTPLASAKSTAYEASRIIKASPGTLYLLIGFSSNASTQYVLIFNAVSLPADGTAPTLPPIIVPPTSNFSVDLGMYGHLFTIGIVVCNSTTASTKTIGAADTWFTAEYL